MKKKKETFAGIIQDFTYHFELRSVFDDFLTMVLTTLCPNPQTGLSHDEDLYLETIRKYAQHDLRHLFPKMYAALVREMEDRAGSYLGNDVLGEWYETHLADGHKGQIFTPWPVCRLMAQIAYWDKANAPKRLKILDPCCGSGRMLLAGSRVMGTLHDYYGIDIDHTCVKMAAINLFFNGVFHGELMWGDSLALDDFRVSYRLSRFPFGVFRISEKEKSQLWHMHQSPFVKPAPPTEPPGPGTAGSQLHFF